MQRQWKSNHCQANNTGLTAIAAPTDGCQTWYTEFESKQDSCTTSKHLPQEKRLLIINEKQELQ